jgi:hypothetical protein
VIERQLDMFEREQGSLLRACDEAERAYDEAERDEAEERYGEYLDLVEEAAEALAELRDGYASTLEEPRRYLREFERASARRLPKLRLQ